MSIINDLQQELAANYINSSACVLIFFESVITFSQEVDTIWSRKWTAMTVLYAAIRYGIVLDKVSIFFPSWNFVSCEVLVRVDNTLQLAQFLSFAIFSALRVYAFSDGKLHTAGATLILNLVPFATNMLNIVTSTVVEDSESCAALPRMGSEILLTLSLVSRISVIIGDVLVITVIWLKTAQSYREARRLNIKAPLATMLLHDGIMYFIMLLLINLLDAVGNNVPILFKLDIAGSFFDTLPPIIVCRLILNLRQVKPAGNSWVSGMQSHSLRFGVGIGQSMQITGSGEAGEGEDEEDRTGLDQYLSQENWTSISGSPELGAKKVTSQAKVVQSLRPSVA